MSRDEIIAEIDTLVGAPDGSDLILTREQRVRLFDLQQMLAELDNGE